MVVMAKTLDFLLINGSSCEGELLGVERGDGGSSSDLFF